MIICSVNLRDGDKVTYLWTVKTLNDKVKLLNNGAKIYWLTINWQNIIVSKINDLMIAKIAKKLPCQAFLWNRTHFRAFFEIEMIIQHSGHTANPSTLKTKASSFHFIPPAHASKHQRSPGVFRGYKMGTGSEYTLIQSPTLFILSVAPSTKKLLRIFFSKISLQVKRIMLHPKAMVCFADQTIATVRLLPQ